MATGGDDLERLSGAVVLSWLSDSSDEEDDSSDSMDGVFAGMDSGEFDEVSSCSEMSDSNVSGKFGEGTEREIDPSLPGPSSRSVGASRRSTRFSYHYYELDSNEEGGRSVDSDGTDFESDGESEHESSPRGKAPRRAKASQKELKLPKRVQNRCGKVPPIFLHSS